DAGVALHRIVGEHRPRLALGVGEPLFEALAGDDVAQVGHGRLLLGRLSRGGARTIRRRGLRSSHSTDTRRDLTTRVSTPQGARSASRASRPKMLFTVNQTVIRKSMIPNRTMVTKPMPTSMRGKLTSTPMIAATVHQKTDQNRAIWASRCCRATPVAEPRAA